jgi:hypothetical protein
MQDFVQKKRVQAKRKGSSDDDDEYEPVEDESSLPLMERIKRMKATAPPSQ